MPWPAATAAVPAEDPGVACAAPWPVATSAAVSNGSPAVRSAAGAPSGSFTRRAMASSASSGWEACRGAERGTAPAEGWVRAASGGVLASLTGKVLPQPR